MCTLGSVCSASTSSLTSEVSTDQVACKYDITVVLMGVVAILAVHVFTPQGMDRFVVSGCLSWTRFLIKATSWDCELFALACRISRWASLLRRVEIG